jgi:hypothetical protein
VSRELAKHYVQHLLSRGYTVEDAQAEVCTGVWEVGGGGYEIRHGKIECPPFSKQRFSFAELADELSRNVVQLELFT